MKPRSIEWMTGPLPLVGSSGGELTRYEGHRDRDDSHSHSQGHSHSESSSGSDPEGYPDTLLGHLKRRAEAEDAQTRLLEQGQHALNAQYLQHQYTLLQENNRVRRAIDHKFSAARKRAERKEAERKAAEKKAAADAAAANASAFQAAYGVQPAQLMMPLSPLASHFPVTPQLPGTPLSPHFPVTPQLPPTPQLAQLPHSPQLAQFPLTPQMGQFPHPPASPAMAQFPQWAYPGAYSPHYAYPPYL